jgi:hypothetical protein
MTVGRPEWKVGAVGSRESPRMHFIQFSKPNENLPFAIDRDVGQRASVRREDRRAGIILDQKWSSVLLRKNQRADDLLRLT